MKTIEKNKDKIKPYMFIDAYNQNVSELCGTILVGINHRCMSFVVVEDDRDNRINGITKENDNG